MGGYGILKIPEWIIKLAYVNFLWFLFSIIGLGIFGIFPATIAMFAVARQWILRRTDVPIMKNFVIFYKKDFFKANLLGFILLLVSFTFYLNFQLLGQTDNPIVQLFYYILLPLCFMFILTAIYTFPVFVHYEMPLFQVLKNAFYTMIVSPLSTIGMVAGFIILFLALRNYPGLLVLFGPILSALLIMWSSHLSFSHILRKQGDGSHTSF